MTLTRHPRGSGDPEKNEMMGSRLRGNDGEVGEKKSSAKDRISTGKHKKRKSIMFNIYRMPLAILMIFSIVHGAASVGLACSCLFARSEESGSEGRLSQDAKETVKSGDEEITYLDGDDMSALLELARTTVERHVRGEAVPEPKLDRPRLKAPGAAFVTLNKDGHLRGCIGHMVARMPLQQCIREMAIAASSQDRRFPPVRPDELDGIEIEISVLTPMIKVPDPATVKVGRDGLYIKQGFRTGVLLPQVPVENGWDRETFLAYTCRKAGLPLDAWKKGAEIYRFEAQVFGEKSK